MQFLLTMLWAYYDGTFHENSCKLVKSVKKVNSFLRCSFKPFQGL